MLCISRYIVRLFMGFPMNMLPIILLGWPCCVYLAILLDSSWGFPLTCCPLFCWVGQKVHLGFSIRWFRKPRMNFLFKPIHDILFSTALALFLVCNVGKGVLFFSFFLSFFVGLLGFLTHKEQLLLLNSIAQLFSLAPPHTIARFS